MYGTSVAAAGLAFSSSSSLLLLLLLLLMLLLLLLLVKPVIFMRILSWLECSAGLITA